MSVFGGDIESKQKKAIAKLQSEVNSLTPEEQKAALDYYDANIDHWKEEYDANAKKRSNLEETVLKFVKKDPIKAVNIVKNPIQIVTEPELVQEAVKETTIKRLEESSKPIWERESTVKVLGKDGADKLQDVFNPARWGENAIDNLGVSDTTKDNLKKYIPVALAGGAALLLITALK